MSKQLIPLTLGAPGFYGLNTQNSGSVLPPGWATIASNVVYDDLARLASRKGYEDTNATVIPNTPRIGQIHEYVDNDGVVVNIVAADNKIWKEVSGVMTDVSGTIATPTGDDWQFVNFNSWCVGFQEGHAPIVATSATTPVFADSGGTQYNGSMGLAAYGRLWTSTGNTLYYSDLLINNFTGGSSGNFDLAKFWPDGMDQAVAIADFNGFLIVFGKHSVIIYENADDPTVMAISDTISNIGCPYRDTVQSIGNDLVFVSNSGVRSLQRAVEQQNLPLTDISQHVRDDVLNGLSGEIPVGVKAIYNEKEGFYLLSLPLTGESFVFDNRFKNDDGTWRATTWTIAPTALSYTIREDMNMSIEDGFMSLYKGFADGADSAGTGGSAYVFDFEGVWNDFGQEAAPFLKVLKSFSVLALGTPISDVTFKWAVDYGSSFKTRALTFDQNAPTRFGSAQFGISTFSGTGLFERVRGQAASTGQVVKLGMTTQINGSLFALQRIDVLAKLGRLGL